jgi:hypothetical protein
MKVISPAAIVVFSSERQRLLKRSARGPNIRADFTITFAKPFQQVTQVTLRYQLGTASEGVQQRPITAK